jgi:hypothetical protein
MSKALRIVVFGNVGMRKVALRNPFGNLITKMRLTCALGACEAINLTNVGHPTVQGADVEDVLCARLLSLADGGYVVNIVRVPWGNTDILAGKTGSVIEVLYKPSITTLFIAFLYFHTYNLFLPRGAVIMHQ